MTILTATLIIEENDGENYDANDYASIIMEAIGNNTTVTVVDGNVSVFEKKR